MFAQLPPSSSDLANGKALFRHLLLQIGGANIENPPPSRDSRRSQLGKIRTSEAARDPSRDDHRRRLTAVPEPGSNGRFLAAAIG